MKKTTENKATKTSLPLSVVVTSTHGWPEIKSCLSALNDQVAAVGGEVVVTDSSGNGLPEEYKSDYPTVRWISMPETPVFVLRGEAIQAAHGDIIASTEDHCVQASDWCESILRAHAERPDTLVIAGAVENGSTRYLIDWANYFMAFCGYAPPVRMQTRKAVPIANVSYKRRAFDDRTDFSPGWLDFDFHAQVLKQRLSEFDERIVVDHYHSHGLVGNVLGNYHNGRSTTGLAGPDALKVHPLRRIWKSISKVWDIVYDTLALMKGKSKYRRAVISSIPFIGLLSVAHVAGEIVGVVRGPGRSPYLVN